MTMWNNEWTTAITLLCLPLMARVAANSTYLIRPWHCGRWKLYGLSRCLMDSLSHLSARFMFTGLYFSLLFAAMKWSYCEEQQSKTCSVHFGKWPISKHSENFILFIVFWIALPWPSIFAHLMYSGDALSMLITGVVHHRVKKFNKVSLVLAYGLKLKNEWH